VLILDEPTAAIDPIGVIDILELLRDLVRDRGLAVLLSSHLLAQVQSVCDRVGIFAAGKLIGVGTVPELASQFGEEAVRIEVGFEDVASGAYASTAKTLASVEGAGRVEQPARAGDPFIVQAAAVGASSRLREALLAKTLQEGLRLSSIREVVPSLDDIYRHALHARSIAPRPGGPQ
jgi:ABC-2 type transport system ATP-binding protein